MRLDFDSETMEITNKLKQVEGYLECEKIVIHNIKKHLDHGSNDENVIEYLKKISAWFDEKILTDLHNVDCTNYRYAAGFIDILLKMPHWKNWINTMEI